ncbi:uncharacterized protein C8R40DRAFT_1073843 [Lentinula edodes]|uniref:uncharacterized protein n=1 Tax=Lentinula edodes TaxID=5353 RepID=UPI001E8EF3BC|nr:uncharacterized protein C8R40DRAFT_1073836 [Lentinula edodes]XP_046080808.1 uncharacterized protein C8R40DRAFT_1073843 [Lentinula edodes]KAH7869707.1 hypothetical protein C8R40DRAFT_1073836 [Lentinula edodes]KAH7869714.1 hypothetical protein C8R40DRAFT_1073843 [Lentinula edodes]KAJ3923320.1 hypothetical protein F5877DRAFT_63416 [Lentinula edodes]
MTTRPRHTNYSPQSSIITLYDTNVQHGYTPQPWAPNIWRVRVSRFILNYKRLPYKTIWVEFADVEVTLRSIGAPPSAMKSDGLPLYTLPVLVDPTNIPYAPVILSNTNNISEYLESTYPSPAVFPAGSRALQSLFVHYIQEFFAKPLLPIMVPMSHQHLSDRSQRHLRNYPSSLSAAYNPQGHSSSHPLPSGPQREQAWLAVKEQFDFIDAIMAKNTGDGDGIVVMGREVTYADFALCSVLLWIVRIAPQDWVRVRNWNGGRWERLWERCKPYMQEH